MHSEPTEKVIQHFSNDMPCKCGAIIDSSKWQLRADSKPEALTKDVVLVDKRLAALIIYQTS